MSQCFYLRHLLEVVVTFLQSSSSVQRFPNAAMFVQEYFAVLLHPVQHLRDRQMDRWRERDRVSKIKVLWTYCKSNIGFRQTR